MTKYVQARVPGILSKNEGVCRKITIERDKRQDMRWRWEAEEGERKIKEYRMKEGSTW